MASLDTLCRAGSRSGSRGYITYPQALTPPPPPPPLEPALNSGRTTPHLASRLSGSVKAPRDKTLRHPRGTPHTFMRPVPGEESDGRASASGDVRVMDLPGKAYREPAVKSRLPPSVTGLGTMGTVIDRSGTGAVCMFQMKRRGGGRRVVPRPPRPAFPGSLERAHHTWTSRRKTSRGPKLRCDRRPVIGARGGRHAGGAAVSRARPLGWARGGRLLARSHGTACLCVVARTIGAEAGRFHDDIADTSWVGEIFLEVYSQDWVYSPRGAGLGSVSGPQSWGRGASPRWLVASATLIWSSG